MSGLLSGMTWPTAQTSPVEFPATAARMLSFARLTFGLGTTTQWPLDAGAVCPTVQFTMATTIAISDAILNCFMDHSSSLVHGEQRRHRRYVRGVAGELQATESKRALKGLQQR